MHNDQQNWLKCLAQARELVAGYRAEAPAGCDPVNVGAVVAAAVIGAGALAYSATSASNSAKAANDANAANVANTNQLNYQQFLQSRGSTGSAILPIYDSATEAAMAQNATTEFNQAAANTLTPSGYQGIVNQNAPAEAGAVNTANNVFNGADLQSEQNAQAGVYAAQNQGVAAQKEATLESLQQSLNNIKNTQAGKGYSGDSFGTQLLNFGARAGANTANATNQANVNIQNASALQGINSNDINRRLSNVALPGTVAAGNANFQNLGAQTANAQTVNNQNVNSNFKIGTQAFQYQNLPQVNPVASTGQIIGQGVGSLASSAGNYLSNQQLIKALNGTSASAANGVNSPLNYGTSAGPATVNGVAQFDPPPTQFDG